MEDPEEEPTIETQVIQVVTPSYEVVNVPLDATEAFVLPDKLIKNSEWILLLFKVFNPHDKLSPIIPNEQNTEELGKKANLLFHHLCGRLDIHIQSRLKKISHQSNFSLQWARKNFAITSVYMVLFNHVKGDLSCLGNTACLLSNNTNNFLLCTNEEAKFQGAYLHRDKNDEEWVRSGSKAGAPDKGFADRNKEHYRGAKSAINDPPSTFYDTFPARNSPRAQRIGSKSWEHLEQHVAAGFNLIQLFLNSRRTMTTVVCASSLPLRYRRYVKSV